MVRLPLLVYVPYYLEAALGTVLLWRDPLPLLPGVSYCLPV
jgi:hypothetical protein